MEWDISQWCASDSSACFCRYDPGRNRSEQRWRAKDLHPHVLMCGTKASQLKIREPPVVVVSNDGRRWGHNGAYGRFLVIGGAS